MDLQQLRNEIDKTDEEILSLFVRRMGLCAEVAEFKRVNNLPVLQSGREKEVIDRITAKTPDELKDGASALFCGIMDISKTLQQRRLGRAFPLSSKPFCPENARKIGCQGVKGAYQEQACSQIFGSRDIAFYPTFEAVFEAVNNGEIDFGVLPLTNSTAGSVTMTYRLMNKYNFYICSRTEVEIRHCLAAKKGTAFSAVTRVRSHEQALSQCSEFLKSSGLAFEACENTAAAAKLCAEESEPTAAICSVACADEYGLEILAEDIADVALNKTRFICISKEFFKPKNADTVSVSLEIPNVKSALYRLLTRFSVNGLDLGHIESAPLEDGSFNARFYIDFKGNTDSADVAGILAELLDECENFKFLGNY